MYAREEKNEKGLGVILDKDKRKYFVMPKLSDRAHVVKMKGKSFNIVIVVIDKLRNHQKAKTNEFYNTLENAKFQRKSPKY